MVVTASVFSLGGHLLLTEVAEYMDVIYLFIHTISSQQGVLYSYLQHRVKAQRSHFIFLSILIVEKYKLLLQTECNFLLRVHEKPQGVFPPKFAKSAVSLPCNHQKHSLPNPYYKYFPRKKMLGYLEMLFNKTLNTHTHTQMGTAQGKDREPAIVYQTQFKAQYWKRCGCPCHLLHSFRYKLFNIF